MHARMTEAKYRDHLCQSAGATEPSETRASPAATLSTDALRIGLAHFIHEINTPLQRVYWTASMLNTLAPKTNGRGDPFVGKMFQVLKGGVDQWVSLVSSLESRLKSLSMIDRSKINDFVLCPYSESELLLRIRRFLQARLTTAASSQNLDANEAGLHFGALVGKSESFVSAINKVPPLAQSDSTVLICGETGTGKELFARANHYHSARRQKPFIPVNCAALPDHLFENELFGHDANERNIERRGISGYALRKLMAYVSNACLAGARWSTISA